MTTRRDLLANAPATLAAASVLTAALASDADAQGAAASRGVRGGRVQAEDFGAAGTGAQDDSIPIQAAIDALEKAGGGIVLLANRTYRIDGTLEIDPTRVALTGARATLDCRRVPAGKPCILVRTKQGSPQYDHAPQFLDGIIVQGGGRGANQTGILLSTTIPSLSTRIVMRNLVVKDVATGVDFGSKTYLCQAYSLQVYGTQTAVRFSSRDDAGENLSFFGCTLGNSDTAVANPAGAIAFFFGCSFDYCRRWFTGSGLVQFHGCWFEKHRPAAAEDVPFELESGNLDLIGGGIMVSGIEFEKGSANSYMFLARKRLARITVSGTFAWNWRSATGELAGGEGTIVLDHLGGQGRKFIPAVVKDDAFHNVFGAAGAFQGKTIDVPCWLGAQGATRVSRHEVKWGNTSALVSLAPQGRAGRQCLKVSKGIGPGTPLTFELVAPARPQAGFGLRLFHSLQASANVPLWFEIFFVQVSGYDAAGIPVMSNRLKWGETQVNAVAAAQKDTGWAELSYNSQMLDENAAVLGYAPAWVTHVHLAANLTACGAGTELLIDSLGGWVL